MLAAGLLSRTAAAKGGSVNTSLYAIGSKMYGIGSKPQTVSSVNGKSVIGRRTFSVSARKEQVAPATAKKPRLENKSTFGLGEVEAAQGMNSII